MSRRTQAPPLRFALSVCETRYRRWATNATGPKAEARASVWYVRGADSLFGALPRTDHVRLSVRPFACPITLSNAVLCDVALPQSTEGQRAHPVGEVDFVHSSEVGRCFVEDCVAARLFRVTRVGAMLRHVRQKPTERPVVRGR